MHVLEHIKDPQELVEEMARVLTSEGQLVLATPGRKNLVGINPTDEHVYTEEELVQLLQNSGFIAEIFHVVPNDKAWKVHSRKKKLATHVPQSVYLRNKARPTVWDAIVLRSGISFEPLSGKDFTCTIECDEKAIDLLALAIKV